MPEMYAVLYEERLMPNKNQMMEKYISMLKSSLILTRRSMPGVPQRAIFKPSRAMMEVDAVENNRKSEELLSFML